MQTNSSDQQISIEKIKQGDADEFERMFRMYYKRMCIYAENIVENRLEAEDIVCDMFVRLWEKRGQLNIRTSLEAYIVSSVHNASLNYLKHIDLEDRYCEKALYRLKHIDLLSPEGFDTPLTDMLDRELYEHIEKALATLPPQCREVFVLHMMDGLSYEEVAQKLNISINTVRTQITRGVKKMRLALSAYTPYHLRGEKKVKNI
ncbi:MAG: RNA polymerase sigma-70 factor [Tannerella sp.]|jgi:RNA polymerase sigma-70 factor (ECF subfamily)|nr:RNA polymerase sigma-70 factor [Tannerella sp.]